METKTVRDETVPHGAWTFDEDVTRAFDDMLARSIPDHSGMRALVYDVGRRHVAHGTSIVDLGAARGEAVAPYVREFGAYNDYRLIEVSPPMLAVLRERFKGMIDAGVVHVVESDLRRPFAFPRASLVLSVLTLQFTPIEHRPRILGDVWTSLAPGGALVLVEKVIGRGRDNDLMFTDLYLELKRRHGYTDEQIERKRLALEGVLVPVTERANVEMLESEGFRRVECFWRWCNFAAWLAVR